MCNVGQNWNLGSSESENFSKSPQFNDQNFNFDLTKKMNTHTLCFCPLVRNLQVFENLKWARGSQRRKQSPWNTAFYVFAAVKYNFLYFHDCEI